ncbi:MAG: hypothetical protein JKY37_01490 [Nannocystaceae bacterium]|nr:hypothetical protein [Nannocystaceae bacterium]
MAKNPISFSQRDGRVRCEIHNLPDWEGLEKLALFLEKQYGASVVERFDGPDARRWVLAVGATRVELQHEDPWGNVLVALDAQGDELVRRIGDDLGARLAGLDPSG